VSLEDVGCCQESEIGAFFDSVDATYSGSFPIKPDGGQFSASQPVGGAGGVRQVIQAARQVMGRAGERQVAKRDLGIVSS
jgi:acetyl-CoA acetyltransferase